MNAGSLILLILFLLCAAGICILALLLAIRPAPYVPPLLTKLMQYDFAHRGLWGQPADNSVTDRHEALPAAGFRRSGKTHPDPPIPENSLPAFAAAAEAGYGIELDIHLTSDGKIVVFHDDNTRRMCGTDLCIEQSTLAELRELRLQNTDEHIPLLSEVLALIDGRVPLLIELKLPTSDLSLCPAFYKLIRHYHGPFLIESFNPFGLAWFRRLHPEIIRGQLSTRFPKSLKLPGPAKWLTTSLLVNFLSRPHFIAYSKKNADHLGFRIAAHLYRAPVFFWTIRIETDYNACKKAGAAAIFEHIRP